MGSRPLRLSVSVTSKGPVLIGQKRHFACSSQLNSCGSVQTSEHSRFYWVRTVDIVRSCAGSSSAHFHQHPICKKLGSVAISLTLDTFADRCIMCEDKVQMLACSSDDVFTVASSLFVTTEQSYI